MAAPSLPPRPPSDDLVPAHASRHKALGRWLLLLGIVTAVGCSRAQPKLAPPKVPGVEFGRTMSATVQDYEEFTGRVEAFRRVDIRAQVKGYLTSILFEDGKLVQKGDRLFIIDQRPYQIELDRARASLTQAEAHWDRCKTDYTRAEQGYRTGAISREEYDRAQGDLKEAAAATKSAAAAVRAADLNLGYTVVTAPISGRISRRLVDPGNYIKADETLLTTLVTNDPIYVSFDVDERTFLQERRSELVKKHHAGNLRPADPALASVLGVGPEVIARTFAEHASPGTAALSEDDLLVQVGLADEEGFSMTAVVDFTDNQLEPNTGTIRLRAHLNNPKHPATGKELLAPGMYARVRFPVGEPYKAVLVPGPAISSDQGQKYVYVVKTVPKIDEETGEPVLKPKKNENGENEIGEDGKPIMVPVMEDVVEYRSVKLGLQHGQWWVVKEGLRDNERVVVSGHQRVRRNKPVGPKEVTIAPPRPEELMASPVSPAKALGALPDGKRQGS